MAKNTPIITHTETLCYAIRCIEGEITKWRNKVRSFPSEDRPMISKMVQNDIDRLQAKLDALKDLYKIETGEDYN